MVPPRVLLPVVASAAAIGGGALGFVVGRKGGSNLRKATNGNDRLLSRQERALVTALVAQGQGHLFRHWPPPGVKDDAKRQYLAAVASAVTGAAGPSLESKRLECLAAPVANTIPRVLEHHGDSREDPYYWLRDDKRKDPKVIAHLTAEKEYTQAVMADTEKLQEQLYDEMRARIQETDQSVPYRHSGYYYYSRTVEGLQYRIHCRRKVPAGAAPPSEKDQVAESELEAVLLDENKRKEEGKHTFYMVGGSEVSPNSRLYAWSEDTVGGERYTLHVKDLSTGEEVMDPIPDMDGGMEWANDNATLFYVVKDELDRPYKVLRHKIGSPTSSDVVVFEEKDDSFYVGISKSRSEQIIFISAGSAVTSEEHFIWADQPTSQFKKILPRENDVEYNVAHQGDNFVVVYRDKSRPNSEIWSMPVSDTTKHEVLIPHSNEIKIEDISLSADYLVVSERSTGLQRARLFKLPAKGAALNAAALGPGKPLDFDEPAYSLSAGCTGDFDSPVLRLNYTSLTTPASTIDHNMVTGNRVTKKVAPVLGGFNKDNYATERLWATSHDGVRVPISVAYRKSTPRDGSAPMLLNGYGSYEISNDPYFKQERLTLLDRGWIFAVAHIRGGGEMGRAWYEDGKFLKKKNTFLDFIACAEHLIAQKYTSSARLSIEGRSAGGLLMGAVINMRPELFAAAIAGVPFVDALTTMLDETIPLTIIEWEEWGQPKEPEYYAYMKSYSPVDNIKRQAYPHLLATGGLHDPRVGYWEPAKLVAKLRAHQTDNSKLLLLKMDMGAGHFSVTGRFERLKETAFEFAFLLKTQGMLGVQPAK